MKRWKTKSGCNIFRVLSGRSNVFLVTNGQKNILIDTSARFMWPKLVKGLKQLNVEKIDYLILTHTHFDHAGNARRIKEIYNARVLVHQDEAAYLSTGENILPKGTNLFTRLLVRLLAKKFLSISRYEPCEYDKLINRDFVLNDVGINALIMHTPGHTSGSVSVIVDDEVAIVGDAMFGVFKGSIYPPYANDVAQMIKSWGNLLKTGCSVFLPSHGSADDRSLVQKEYNKRIVS